MSGVKQVIVIRRDLKMRRGKEVTQGGHAAIWWLLKRIQPGMVYGAGFTEPEFSYAEIEWMIPSNQRKITVQVEGEAELLALHEKAKAAGVTAELVTDAGLTEFGGVPTITCLAIGPDRDENIDPITSHLKLY